MSQASISPVADPGTRAGAVRVVVNARHLTGPRTGIEVYMEQLLAALSRTGQVEITALSWAPLNLGLPGVREVIPVRRPVLGGLRATAWKLWFDQWYSLRAVADKESLLVHGMDGFLPYSLRSHDRCIVTIHDLGWQVHPELYDRRLRLMYGGLFPWVRRRADRFIAVSRYTADDLVQRAGISASKIDVVYHGLDPVFATPAGRSPHPAAGGTPYVLAVGGVSPRKNTRRLISAFTQWRARGGHRAAYRLLITGTSIDRDFTVDGARLPDGVSLLGYVDKADLPGLYANAAAFLYPGIYEG
ncbi:MAG TPA: glycosyltransferase family 1 protein, partial [Gemmatimonadales bacterium]